MRMFRLASARPRPLASSGAAPSGPRAPLSWVPSLYFAMGTPMIAVTVLAAIMYKNLGLTNTQIALYTGSLYLPWVIKPVWAPLLELVWEKRSFVIAMQVALALSFSCIALSLGSADYLTVSLVSLWITGFASATQDIAADGVYIAAMDPAQQARYVGVQGLAWNGGRLLASGVLVELTQLLHTGLSMSWLATWASVMFGLAVLMLLLAVWHFHALPRAAASLDSLAQPPAHPSAEAPRPESALNTIRRTWVTFLQKDKVWLMLAVVFFYRFGEGFIDKIGPLFLMDARADGGLGLDNAELGRIYGSYATVGFLGGTLLGGLFAAKKTLPRCFWWLAVALNVPHVTYFYLSVARPTDLTVVAAVVTLEKFGFGFGSVGHMLYMMQQVAPGRYRTAHYAFATGVMGLSMMVTGMLSGMLQEALGYRAFFVFVLVASVPPIVLAWLAPFRREPAPVTA